MQQRDNKKLVLKITKNFSIQKKGENKTPSSPNQKSKKEITYDCS